MPPDVTSPGKVVSRQGRGRLRVAASAQILQQGVVVCLTGGELSHIGAVGIGVPRPSQVDPAHPSSTSSVFTLTGHREDNLAKLWAGELALRLQRPVVVVAGIHIANATPADVVSLETNANGVMERLAARLSSIFWPSPSLRPVKGVED